VSQLWRYPVKSLGGERLADCRVERRVGIPGDRSWAVRDERAGEIRGAKKLPTLLRLAARCREEPTGEAVPPVEIRLPDGRVVDGADPRASAVLSELLGREVTLCARRPADDLAHYRRAQRIDDVEAEIRIASELLPDEAVPEFDEFDPALLEYVSPPGTYFDGFELHLLTRASLAELAGRMPGAGVDARRFRPNVLVDTGASACGFPEFDWCGRRLRVGEAVGQVVSPMLRCGMTIHAQADLPKEPRIMRALLRETGMTLGVGVAVVEPGAVRLGDAVELIP
jgi:uncharacterized protein YcbX